MKTSIFSAKFKVYFEKKSKRNFSVKVFVVVFYNFKLSFGQLMNSISEKCGVFGNE